MLKEFKEFISRGNVIDLAVAVVLGASFTAVVTSFANDILLQLVAVVGGEPDFSDLTFTISDTPIYYGRFLTALVSFLIVGFGVFLVVKAINAAQTFGREKNEEAPTPKTDEVVVLEEIRDLLRSGH
jgi:large conductance mechanosensitive channel